jgi:hypothetical protein
MWTGFPIDTGKNLPNLLPQALPCGIIFFYDNRTGFKKRTPVYFRFFVLLLEPFLKLG